MDRERHACGNEPSVAEMAGSTIRLRKPGGVFRRVYWFEQDQVRRHLLRLSPDDRYLRFGGIVGDRLVEAYCARRDWRRESVAGFWVGGELRAVGELKPIGHGWLGEAEVALSVETPWQNHDVGTELLKRMAVIARNRLITSLRLVCLPSNAKLLSLVRKLDAELSLEPSEAKARLMLGSPSQLTVMLELLDEASGFFGGLQSQHAAERLAS